MRSDTDDASLGTNNDQSLLITDGMNRLRQPCAVLGLSRKSPFSFVGAAKFKSPYGCVTCHRIGKEGGRVGPELTRAGSRLATNWIYHWINNPKRWKHDVRMPVFSEMTDDDRAAITRYLSEQK